MIFNKKTKFVKLTQSRRARHHRLITIVYRPFYDAAKIMFYIGRKKSLISITSAEIILVRCNGKIVATCVAMGKQPKPKD